VVVGPIMTTWAWAASRLCPRKVHSQRSGRQRLGRDGDVELARIFAAGRDSLRPESSSSASWRGDRVLGSTFYVNNPVVPLEKTALMLNLDTIGRMRERRLYAAGVGSSPVIKGLIERPTPRSR